MMRSMIRIKSAHEENASFSPASGSDAELLGALWKDIGDVGMYHLLGRHLQSRALR